MNKQFSIAACLALLSINCWAQLSAVALLDAAKCNNAGCFERFALNEEFAKNAGMGSKGNGGNQYSYIAKAVHDSTGTADYLSCFLFSDKSETQVFFATDMTSVYTTLMQGFKDEGFYFDRTINDNDETPTEVYISNTDLSYYVLVRKYPATIEGRWRYYFQVRKFFKW